MCQSAHSCVVIRSRAPRFTQIVPSLPRFTQIVPAVTSCCCRSRRRHRISVTEMPERAAKVELASHGVGRMKCGSRRSGADTDRGLSLPGRSAVGRRTSGFEIIPLRVGLEFAVQHTSSLLRSRLPQDSPVR